jgi:hypothetical protein
MTTTTGIYIHPSKHIEIREVDGLDDLQAAVEGYIEAVYLSDGSTLWVNEEFLLGKFGPEDANWVASDVASLGGRSEFMLLHPILGPVILCGPADSQGEGTSVSRAAVSWVIRVAREAGTPEEDLAALRALDLAMAG